MQYRIFTEGIPDQNFIKVYLRHIFGEQFDQLDISYRSTGGYTTLGNSNPLLEEITDLGGKNILIFDTDFVHTGGGYMQRRNYLLAEKERLNIQFELFLFPNSQDEGEFENLLETIVNSHHSSVLRCFDGYEDCVARLNDLQQNVNYYLPDNKTKIYAYVEALTPPNRFKDAMRDKNYFYSDANYWDLNSDNLQPLRDFLLDNITLVA